MKIKQYHLLFNDKYLAGPFGDLTSASSAMSKYLPPMIALIKFVVSEIDVEEI